MFKKRTRPQSVIASRTKDPQSDEETEQQDKPEEQPPLDDLIAYRKWKKARQGIDATKLVVGDNRRRKRVRDEAEAEKGANVKVESKQVAAGDDDESDDDEAKARRAVRANNFTGQTNTLQADQHMMQYIEENMRLRNKKAGLVEEEPASVPTPDTDSSQKPAEKYKGSNATMEEGSVTNSAAMLTAIPEVDLGMDVRLKNIEETEKAKRLVAEERQTRKKPQETEEVVGPQRLSIHRSSTKTLTDQELYRIAKLEAEGHHVPHPEEHRKHNEHHSQSATDEAVMERFKKRMRR
ncbi:hypothetical protein SISNIDRAFT_481739 [Sistotremastrum niveocremeum HHB9708]|uniref:Uncharacterized protein n=1 Tax=Sistotremastrum niveocremeum HHB9708 TaxID=1314777 RepID=A0A164ZME5_9AGAM|nr:hypothetical protein SISNIDRAFT_481739 [Sistotremastrum niveocremeum HHB9708]